MKQEYTTDMILQNEKGVDETPCQPKMTEEEIKLRLSQRAEEYFMFMDD